MSTGTDAGAPTPAGPLRDLRHHVDSWDVEDLVPRTTLVAATVALHYDPASMVAAAVVTLVAWTRPSLYRAWWFWLAAAAALTARLAPRWDLTDDHVWLVVYWAVALGLAFTTRDPRCSMARSARLLIGLVFLLAALWKIATPEFRDATFFQYALLADDRFAFVATSIGGVEQAAMDSNEEAIRSLGAAASAGHAVTLESGPRIPAAAWAFTVWGMAIEAAVALAWLAPMRAPLRWLRPATLLAFMVTTYAVVPVGGFALILTAMALTHTATTDRSWRLPLLAVAVGILLYGPLWQALFGP